jgi:Na+-driven multidrug efflux pump
VEVQARVCQSLIFCQLLGLLGALLMVSCPQMVLSSVLRPRDAPAMDFAAPYLRLRQLGIIPNLIGATGSAAYRGLLDTFRRDPHQELKLATWIIANTSLHDQSVY